MKEVTEAYCLYCKLSERKIRKKNLRIGYRIPCVFRDTPNRFHKFGMR